MITQQRVELKFAADKSTLSASHKTGTVSRVFANGDFTVAFDPFFMDDGKRVQKCAGGRFTYPASRATSFTVIG